MSTVRDLIGACLRAQGSVRAFGPDDPLLPGIQHVPVDDPSLACLLADADGRIAPRAGVAFFDGNRLRLSSRPGGAPEPVEVTEAERIPGLIASWSIGTVHATVELRLDLDLDGSASDDLEPLQVQAGGDFYSLSPTLADLNIIVLAGPGVVRDGKVDALQHFAGEAGVGVLNTWGAKGVFPWDSPHHFGTGGMQEHDYELAGFGDADVILAVGVDEEEAPRDRWALTQVLDAEPWQLPALAFNWSEQRPPTEPPALYRELAAALQPLYASDEMPLSPARAAADLAQVRPGGGLVVADPGPAGLWVARCFPTTEPGSVVVPATIAPGFAAAAAWLGALDGRPTVGITTTPLDDETDAVIELARKRGGQLILEEWGADGGIGDAAAHAKRLEVALQSGGVDILPTPVEFAHTRTLVEVAGPVIAWT